MRSFLRGGRRVTTMTVYTAHGRFAKAEPVAGIVLEIQVFMAGNTVAVVHILGSGVWA